MGKIIVSIIFVIALFLSTNTNVYAFDNDNNTLIISEALMNPTSCGDSDCEYIELYNNTESKINIADWTYNSSTINSYVIPAKSTLVIARELLDGDDSDEESYEARWGNGDGIWGNSESENYYVVDDDILGFTLNLSNSSGSILLEHPTEISNTLSWDSDEYIAYEYIMNSSTYVGILSEDELNPGKFETPICEDDYNILINNEIVLGNHVNLVKDEIVTFQFDIVDTCETLTFMSNIKFKNEIAQSYDTESFEYSFENIGEYVLDIKLKSKDYIISERSINILVEDVEIDYPVVELSEIFPNPDEIDSNEDGSVNDSGDEWIELYNPNDYDVDIINYMVADETDKDSPYQVDDSLIIKAKSYKIIFSSDIHITLNNSSDTIYLYNPEGEIIDIVNYSNSMKDKSISKINNEWTEDCVPTPNTANDDFNSLIDKEDGEAEESIEVQIDSIGDKVGENVIIEGIVSVDPNLLGDKILYIQDDTDGVKVIDSNRTELIKGDKVLLTGVVKESSNGIMYLSSKEEQEIRVLSHNNEIQVKKVEINNISDNYVGKFVNITGTIKKTSGSTFWIEQNGKVIKIYVKKSTGINLPRKSVGDLVDVSGIIDKLTKTDTNNASFVIYPAYAEDIKISSVKGASSRLANTGGNITYTITTSASLLLLAVMCMIKIICRKKLIYSHMLSKVVI